MEKVQGRSQGRGDGGSRVKNMAFSRRSIENPQARHASLISLLCLGVSTVPVFVPLFLPSIAVYNIDQHDESRPVCLLRLWSAITSLRPMSLGFEDPVSPAVGIPLPCGYPEAEKKDFPPLQSRDACKQAAPAVCLGRSVRQAP